MNKRILMAILPLILLSSCEEGGLTDCGYCYDDLSGPYKLEIEVDNPYFSPYYVIITVYEGPVENNIILYRYTTDWHKSYVDAVLYKNYTVTAEYNFYGQHYLATDETCLQVRYDDTSCENPCYYVYGNKINLKLRYL